MTHLPGMGPSAGSGVPAHLADRVHACRSCGAPIMWAMTGRGKTMPVDAAPSDGGNVTLTLDGGTLRAVVSAGDAGLAHLSHFVSCPKAEKHRRRRG